VVAQKEVKIISSKYILPRWSKLIQRRYTSITVAYNTKSDDPQMQRYQALCKEFFDIVDVACETKLEIETLFKQLKSIHTQIGSSSSCMHNYNIVE